MTEERGNGTHKRVSQVIALAFVLLLTVGVNPASGQEQACGRRAALRVTVLDESGAIVLPGATVVVRWTDAERMPVRTSAGGTGSVVVCVPFRRDASRVVGRVRTRFEHPGRGDIAEPRGKSERSGFGS